jgi:GMP synthase (glutamine-hydrolysing)
MSQTVVIINFGSQYRDLIARRVREINIQSVIKPHTITPEEIKEIDPIAIILTGSPKSVYDADAPLCDKRIFTLGIPILGICYGMQLICHSFGGLVAPCEKSEYGTVDVTIDGKSAIFEGLDARQSVLMSHTEHVTKLPEDFIALAHSENCRIAAAMSTKENIFCVQFHPEVEHTKNGVAIFKNFLYGVCKAKGDYNMRDFLEAEIGEARAKVGKEKVILGLSGGVDSSVCAALLSKAIGKQLICIFVDHGLMRKNEAKEIADVFSKWDLQFISVDASQRFLKKLEGVCDPEQKRKIIGKEFVDVFQEQAKAFGAAKFLAQGTIYPDIIESGTDKTATIKSHHNVGGLPKDIGFEGLVEPLRGLFKDEVRKLGALLGLPDSIINRQPFPGPGLGVRIIGEVTKEKLDLLREADAIVRQEVQACGVRADQYFAVLTDLRSVGVMGDGRTYDYTVAVRAVTTIDFMTCDYARIPHETLAKISSRITNDVKGINRVVFDITGKPPATIEWE